MSSEAVAALRKRVHDDSDLATELARTDLEHFRTAIVERAQGLGLDVTPADVDEAIAAGRRAWTMRWIR